MTPTKFPNGDKFASSTRYQLTQANTHQREVLPFVGLGTST